MVVIERTCSVPAFCTMDQDRLLQQQPDIRMTDMTQHSGHFLVCTYSIVEIGPGGRELRRVTDPWDICYCNQVIIYKVASFRQRRALPGMFLLIIYTLDSPPKLDGLK